MTPVEQAKQKLAAILFALDAPKDMTWSELLIGGWEVQANLPDNGSILRGRVTPNGDYRLTAERDYGDKGRAVIPLCSGSCAPPSRMETMTVDTAAIPLSPSGIGFRYYKMGEETNPPD